MWHEDANLNYNWALKIFQSLDMYNYEIRSLNSIANTMLVTGQIDSAQYYYQLALNQAYLHKDTTMLEMVYNNMGSAYIQLGLLDKAYHYIKQALQFSVSNDLMVNKYLNFATIFNEQNDISSARFYIQMADSLMNSINNDFVSAYLAYLSYQIEKKAGNYSKAMEYLEINYDLKIEILENNDRKLLLEMQRKYDITLKEKIYHEEINKVWRIVVCLLLSLLALVVCTFYVLRKNIKQKAALVKAKLEETENKLVLDKMKVENTENMLTLEKIKLENTENLLALERAEREKIENEIELEKSLLHAQTLREMFDRMQTQMKTQTLNKIETIKKMGTLYPYLKNDIYQFKNDTDKLIFIHKTKEIVNELNVKNFVDIANELYPNFTDKLKQTCDALDEREVIICCLVLFDFSNEEIDLFFEKNSNEPFNTIRTWKGKIRRKMGIIQNGDIKKHLLNEIIDKKELDV